MVNLPIVGKLSGDEAMELFKRCCSEKPSIVTIAYDAMNFARTINLKTESDVKNFIVDGGLECATLQDIEEFRNNTKKSEMTIWAYAFGFFTGDRYLYLSILHPQFNGGWRIKSLKQNEQKPTQMQLALLQANKKAKR